MSQNWEGKKVFVTGADGFIGSHLTEELVRKGAKVQALAYYNSFGTWGWLDTVAPEVLDEIEVVMGDIRDPGQMQNCCKGMDTVFHLASLIAIPYSYAAPDSYVQTNIQGTLNVLNAVRSENVDRLVHTSTSETYGSALYVPIDEKHPLQGQSPYSASKISADMMAMSYYNSFDTPVAIARPFNTYGPRQSARAVIPTILSQLMHGETKIQLGSLHPTRDFNYVSDTVAGFLAIAESQNTVGEVTNIGSGKEISIGDLVQLMGKICEVDLEIQQDDNRLRPEKSEVNRLLASSEKITRLTGWTPQVDLETGLKKTAEWISQNKDSFRKGTYQT